MKVVLQLFWIAAAALGLFGWGTANLLAGYYWVVWLLSSVAGNHPGLGVMGGLLFTVLLAGSLIGWVLAARRWLLHTLDVVGGL